MQSTIIYPGSFLEIVAIINQLGKRNILLVTGKSSFNDCGAKSLIENMLGDFNLVYFSDFKANPDVKDVEKGVAIFIQSNAEIIISIGGGSVIDMGKLINYYHNFLDTNKISEQVIDNPQFKPVPFICIPTTAGSGSEATHFAVMYIGNTKFSVAHSYLLPAYTIIDPELHYTQTPYQKAVSGIDAFSQAIESLWSVQSTEESRAYSEKALKLIWENLQKVVHSGDELAHLKVAIGANFAGKAINIAKTTAPHAFSYYLTKKINLPHGHAVAFFLPCFIAYNLFLNKSIEDLDVICENSIKIRKLLDLILFNEKDERLDAIVVTFLQSIGLEMTPEKLNITSNDILDALVSGNKERLKNNPRTFILNDFINETSILNCTAKKSNN